MESIDYLRNALRDLAATSVGLWSGNPRAMVAHMRAQQQAAAILAMPVETADYTPLQDLDPTSDTFGMIYFVADYSVPDSAPLRDNAGGT